MKQRFTGEQIPGVLKQADAAAKVVESCRRYGNSYATHYNWKAKLGGMSVSDAQRLKAPEAENAKVKRLLTELCWTTPH